MPSDGRTGGERRLRTVTRPDGADFDEVLRAARAGEAWAWDGLYAELSPVVLGYLRGQRAPHPEDLLGEVFLQVVRDLAGFVGCEAQFRSWVFTIAHHRLLDARRYESRRPVAAMEADALAARSDAGADTTQRDALEALATEEIHLLFEALTEEQRTALLLRVVAGLTIGEIAEVLGKRPGAVKQLQRRGITALRTQLSSSAYPRREGWTLTEAT